MSVAKVAIASDRFKKLKGFCKSRPFVKDKAYDETVSDSEFYADAVPELCKNWRDLGKSPWSTDNLYNPLKFKSYAPNGHMLERGLAFSKPS